MVEIRLKRVEGDDDDEENDGLVAGRIRAILGVNSITLQQRNTVKENKQRDSLTKDRLSESRLSIKSDSVSVSESKKDNDITQTLSFDSKEKETQPQRKRSVLHLLEEAAKSEESGEDASVVAERRILRNERLRYTYSLLANRPAADMTACQFLYTFFGTEIPSVGKDDISSKVSNKQQIYAQKDN